jgi:hypothetical protein
VATTHDGIICPLAPNAVSVVVGLAMLGGGAWLGVGGTWLAAVPLLLLGLLVLVNQKGTRRIRVIATKLVVEDERLIRALLIGPARSRVEWTKVKAVKIDGASLRLDTDGAPFVTAQGAAPADLAFLLAKVNFAMAKDRAEAGA